MESSLQTAEPRSPALAQPSAAARRRHRNPRGQGARLTQDIVAGALALIERTGSAEAVTLRAVAREVGIAAPSIYAHFPDRDAVLMAVVARIFDELTAAIEQGKQAAGQDPACRLAAGCEAYVAFGLEHPARYGVLFSRQRPACAGLLHAGPDRAGRPAGPRIRGRVVRAPRPGHPGLRHRRGLREHRRRLPMPPPCGSRCTGPSACARRSPRFPWPEPAAFVRQLVLSLAQVTA